MALSLACVAWAGEEGSRTALQEQLDGAVTPRGGAGQPSRARCAELGVRGDGAGACPAEKGARRSFLPGKQP